MFNFRRASISRPKMEQGYSWHFFYAKRSWVFGCLVTLLVIGVSGTFYLWYNYNGDVLTPGGNVGLSYALAGFMCLLLAAVLYSVRRRLSEPALGQLNRALNWHGFFALIGLALLFMHSFGEFGPNSGTYALLSMIILTLSGLIGRVLDRVLAWRIAVETNAALTVEGEDRVETITQEMRTLVTSQSQETNHFDPRSSTSQSHPVPIIQENISWDLSYRSLEKKPQEVKRQGQQKPFILDHELRSALPGVVRPSSQMQMAALQEIQQAMQREGLYRLIIRIWRQVHIALAFLTLILTVWHVVYEMPFLSRALFH